MLVVDSASFVARGVCICTCSASSAHAGKVFGTKRDYIVAEAEYQEGEGEEEEQEEGEGIVVVYCGCQDLFFCTAKKMCVFGNVLG